MFLKHDSKYIKNGGSYIVNRVYTGNSLTGNTSNCIKTFIKTETNEMSWITYEIESHLNDGSQIIVVMRHSERNETGDRTLTENGVEYARRIGRFIGDIKGDYLNEENCSFFSTNVTGNRTRDTARYISEGMFGSIQNVDTDNASKFRINYIDGDDWPTCANYSNNPSNEESQANVSKQIINGCYSLLGNKKFGLFVSHDFNTLPLVVWVTNHNLTFDFSGKSEWLCYMAGIIVIVKDGEATMKPIYSIDSYLLVDGSWTTIGVGQSGYKGVMRQGYENVLPN